MGFLLARVYLSDPGDDQIHELAFIQDRRVRKGLSELRKIFEATLFSDTQAFEVSKLLVLIEQLIVGWWPRKKAENI